MPQIQDEQQHRRDIRMHHSPSGQRPQPHCHHNCRALYHAARSRASRHTLARDMAALTMILSACVYTTAPKATLWVNWHTSASPRIVHSRTHQSPQSCITCAVQRPGQYSQQTHLSCHLPRRSSLVSLLYCRKSQRRRQKEQGRPRLRIAGRIRTLPDHSRPHTNQRIVFPLQLQRIVQYLAPSGLQRRDPRDQLRQRQLHKLQLRLQINLQDSPALKLRVCQSEQWEP